METFVGNLDRGIEKTLSHVFSLYLFVFLRMLTKISVHGHSVFIVDKASVELSLAVQFVLLLKLEMISSTS